MNSSDYPGTFDGVAQILQRLRGPDGCPWDREQTRDSLKSQFLEEAYELIEAIEQGDTEKIIEEIGDVILHVVYQVQIGEEAGEFNREHVFQTLVKKLLRRHPHVFGDASVADADDAVVKWQAIKQQERADTGASILDGAPRQMPALSYAEAIQERAARVGFDWEDLQGALDKITEELEELEQAQSDSERESELGDVLFSIVNAARWQGIDAESALRHSNARFYQRFVTMEGLSREKDQSLPDLSLDEKEALWQEAKRLLD